jgi:hypothetical protein
LKALKDERRTTAGKARQAGNLKREMPGFQGQKPLRFGETETVRNPQTKSGRGAEEERYLFGGF